MTRGKPVVLMCGNVFHGVSGGLSGSGEVLVRDGKLAEVAHGKRRLRYERRSRLPRCRDRRGVTRTKFQPVIVC